MMHKVIMLVCLTGTILGCKQTVKPVIPSPTQPTIETVVSKIAPHLLDRCPLLPAPSTSTAGDLLQAYATLQGQYSSCAIKDDCLIGAVTGKPCTTTTDAKPN